ncbi:hypothetical protein TSAR_007115, partial [Trichomalopsis sarcophagae]
MGSGGVFSTTKGAFSGVGESHNSREYAATDALVVGAVCFVVFLNIRDCAKSGDGVTSAVVCGLSPAQTAFFIVCQKCSINRQDFKFEVFVIIVRTLIDKAFVRRMLSFQHFGYDIPLRNSGRQRHNQPQEFMKTFNNKSYKTREDEGSPGVEDRRRRYQVTGDLVYLGEGLSVTSVGFNYMCKQPIKQFLRWLALKIWEHETLMNRALQIEQ